MKTIRSPFTIAFLVVPFLLGSCGPDHSENLEALGELENELSELEERYDSVQREKATELKNSVTESERLFQEHFEGDTMGEDLFQILEAYKRVRKSLENFENSDKLIRKELDKSGQQLDDLRKDLKDGLHSEEKAGDFVDEEAENLERIREALQEQESRTKAAFRNYRKKPGKLSGHVSLPDSLEWPEEEKQ